MKYPNEIATSVFPLLLRVTPIAELDRDDAIAQYKPLVLEAIQASKGAGVRAKALEIGLFGARFVRTKDGTSSSRVIDAILQRLRVNDKIAYYPAIGWVDSVTLTLQELKYGPDKIGPNAPSVLTDKPA